MSLFKSKDEEKQSRALLAKSTPSYRKAYSDRTAWFMACASELAYRKFDPPTVSAKQQELLQTVLEKTVPKTQSKIIKLLKMLEYDNEEEVRQLRADLEALDAELLQTFDQEDTQAILLKTNAFVVLAFRGTESTSWGDIKTDLKAKLSPCRTKGRVHSGFQRAFYAVERQVCDALAAKELANLPLFITGHSLGGALATVAAKLITHSGGNAACYTFGSPRVADDEWLMQMKTPVYRVVNAADGVTLVPFKGVLIQAFGGLLGLIPYVGKPVKKWMYAHVNGYLHAGDMRYLTNIAPNAYKQAELLTHVDVLYRAKSLWNMALPFKNVLSDHFIVVYRRKLAEIAARRNL